MASTPQSRRAARRARLPLASSRSSRTAAAAAELASDQVVADSDPTYSSESTLRRASREQLRNERRSVAVGFEGFPDFAGLKPILGFFIVPVTLALAIVATGGNWPGAVLYPIALLMGMYVAYSTLNGLELVVACMLFYFPFSTTHAIPIAPAVNGTNMLILLGLGGALFQAYKGRGFFVWLPGTALIYLFGFTSALSGVTTLMLPGGFEYLRYSELLNYKGWLEQFAFIFVLHCAIRDHATAKRMLIYMTLASMALLLYVVPELIEKAGRSTIEASRLEGPHRQSNNFGGFVAYTLMPPLALFTIYIHNARSWLLTPYFLLGVKILITTFSRGAYLAIALGAFCAGYFRGKGFLVFWASLGLVFVLIFPQVIPESIKARMQTLSGNDHNVGVSEDQLDASSRDRLIMWRAAIRMTLENPITGMGFKAFPKLKDSYTDAHVTHISDPHNMYLSIASEMGIPVLSLFLLILWNAYRMGSVLSNNPHDAYIRGVGVGGVAATACYAVICIFGSRAVNLEFSAFFWCIYVVLQVLMASPERLANIDKKRKRRKLPLVSSRRENRAQAWSQSPADVQARRAKARKQRASGFAKR